jgi:ribosome-associated protein
LTEAAEIAIHGEMIRLGQFLKLAGAVDGGGEAKALLARGAVTVNGETEVRRGRQLRVGDRVRTGVAEWRVSGAAAAESGS